MPTHIQSSSRMKHRRRVYLCSVCAVCTVPPPAWSATLGLSTEDSGNAKRTQGKPASFGKGLAGAAQAFFTLARRRRAARPTQTTTPKAP